MCVLVDVRVECGLPYPGAELLYAEAVGIPYAPPVEMKTTGLTAASARMDLSERVDTSSGISVWGGGKTSDETASLAVVSGDAGMD